jgi:hypothetical protein
MEPKFIKAKSAIITVGDGRGCIVNGRREPIIITAAHCLPFLPPACIGAVLEGKTYRELLAPLGGKPAVWAECLFADPVTDIAILGSPDNQELCEQANAYEAISGARNAVIDFRCARAGSRLDVVIGGRMV